MDFFGQGATAFANAVENNIAHSGRFINKMSDFQLATSNLLSLINYNNTQVGDLERLQYARTPYNTFDDYAPEVYGYTSLEIVRELRETAFRFSDMNTVMDKGKGVSYFIGFTIPGLSTSISFGDGKSDQPS